MSQLNDNSSKGPVGRGAQNDLAAKDSGRVYGNDPASGSSSGLATGAMHLDSVDGTSIEDHTLPLKNGKPLRLLFAVDSRFPGLGGAESQALKLAIALREKGVQLEFIAPRVIDEHPLTDVCQGFKVTRIDYPRVRFLGSLVVMARFARYLIANADRFDAVHVHITHLMAAAAGYSRRGSGLPVTTKISGFYEFEGGVLDPSARFKPLNFLIRRGLKKVDFVQTISQQTREKLLASGFSDDQIKFIPNGIDTRELPVPAPVEDTLRIGYCGRLREIKGVHVLIDGLAELKAALPDNKFQVVVAGSGETMEALKQQATRLKLDDTDIEWLGRIEDTAAFFRSIHLYVQPSFAEGLPNSVMEAMVAERPVVVSDIGGNNDLVEHEASGLLFPAGDAKALALQLQRVIEDEPLRSKLAKAGRQLMIDRYGFDAVTHKLAELYSSGAAPDVVSAER